MVCKKFAIITSTNSRCGDFLIKHWLKSIIENIDIKKIDIIILDYGLNEEQKKNIIDKDVKIINCKKEGHIVNVRYKNMLDYLKNHPYDQILSCDGGDIIFQKDIEDIFLNNKDEFRAVCEDFKPFTLEYNILMRTFSEDFTKELISFLKNKKMINGGFVVAPYKKFMNLCMEMDNRIINKNAFGPDQIVLNYFLYKEGFIELDRTYNFIPNTADEEFNIVEGIFYRKNNDKIAVVHNAGGKAIFRPIKNFGYGKEYNNLSYITYHFLRTLFRMNLLVK